VLVDELWLAGAEAIAINTERLTAGTAILDIGGSVLVNSAYLSPPYQVSAIGPTDLYDQLSRAQGFRDFVRARAESFGIRISYAELTNVVVPAYAGTVNLRYARAVPSPTAQPATPSFPATPGTDAGSGATAAPATSAPQPTPGARPTPAASLRGTPKPARTPRPTPRPT
jgi:hypothetical protein